MKIRELKTSKKIGILLIFIAFIISIYCIINKNIFLPTEEYIDIYLISKNILLISMINWIFLIGLKLINYKENRE